MLPVASNTSPTLTGMSSSEKYSNVCSTLSSHNRKFCRSSPATSRPFKSDTVALTSTTGTSTFSVWLLNVEVAATAISAAISIVVLRFKDIVEYGRGHPDVDDHRF